MAESVTPQSTLTKASETSSRARWLRLLRSAFWFGSYVVLISFVTDIFWNVRDHNFSFGGVTRVLLLDWFVKALAEGVFFGLFLAFPVWLAREEFPPPKRRQRDRPRT